ncbi:ATP-binding cassette domain-containing protein [Haloarcula amylovorans]|uniref:ATP-binding cassette domain-containing protein n=1 Tax=Haloarcula amylovorans TaxID=2562280 RepID=UPI001075EB6E|nr:ATP-binding cassette domain-containing protein [Halomicroarcula amylolytica]
MASDSTPLVEVRGLSKNFGNIQALNDVDFDLKEGEVHGLLGDNGSGKSTFVKVLVGIHDPTAGEIFIRGEPVKISGPKDARSHGIATVYQDLALVDELSLAQNMFLGRMPHKSVAGVIPAVDYKQMRERAEEILSERLNIHLDPTTKVESLSGGERQAVAIARALVTDPDILIMDEPTSALSADSTERVQELIKTLQSNGIAVLMISHDLNEVFDLTDRITVLDNGDLVGTIRTEDVVEDDVLGMMMGSMPTEKAPSA